MRKSKKISGKFSLLTIFILLMNIITMDVYAAKLPFTDVPEKSWYYDDVKSAYESNLISGKKPTKYAPNDNMTAAEAVKLAAAMHMLKNQGAVKFTPSKPWYKVYVDYAKQKGLISGDLNWNKNITRAGYMQIFANILTDEEAKKNEVSDGAIPDVPMTHPSAKAIYKLYRAGIVTGIDEKKNCSPASNIKRSEVAAILIRMMEKKRRLGFSLGGGTTPGTTTPPGGTTPPPGGTTPPPPAAAPLKITKQPENATNRLRQKVTLEVAVEGGKEPYSYQWQRRSSRLLDYTNSTAEGNNTNILKPEVEPMGYFYRCVITDANGDKVTSKVAKVETDEFNTPLKITKQPENATNRLRQQVTLEVEVEGGKKPYSYQWQRRSSRLLDYTNSTAEGNNTNILKPEVEPMGYFYRCVITDAKGKSVTSKVAKVETDEFNTPLKITKQPEDASSNLAYKVTLEVAVEGGKKPYSYQWQVLNPMDLTFKDSKAEGNNTNVLRPSVQIMDSFYRCVITDANGKSVTSREAKVEVYSKPLKITKQPVDAMGPFEKLVILEVEAEGGLPPYRYQWQFREYEEDSDDFENSTSAGNTTNVLMPPVEAIPYEYHCIVTDSAGNTVTSNIARVEMPPSPNPIRITQQPKSVRGKAGDYTKLTIKVEGGKKPYYYYWYRKKMVDREFEIIYDYDFKYDNPELKVKITDDIWEYYCDVCDYDHYHIESNRVTVHNNDYVTITI